ELARAYSEGVGVDADPIMAHAYANLAAARGHVEAASLRDELGARLRPEELKKAHATARDWKALPIDQTGE
ncbi:sel1 repeat family protein, partial [Sinorhizobium meliloti]